MPKHQVKCTFNNPLKKLTEVMDDKDEKQPNNNQGLQGVSFPFQECL